MTTRVTPESRKSFEAEDSDFAGLGAMEVYSSSEMGKCLALENARPRTRSRPKQTMISPGKSDQVRRFTFTVCRRSDDLGLIAFPGPAQENNARFSSKWTLSRCTKGKVSGHDTLSVFVFLCRVARSGAAGRERRGRCVREASSFRAPERFSQTPPTAGQQARRLLHRRGACPRSNRRGSCRPRALP